ncbi:hypothetical protein BGX23_005135 [Mortierella sp. AD031]|nr:hypothetical protein BGX23_005135 [Mortierella sp. AD031]
MPESETVKIECQLDDDGREAILWEDTLLVFDNALHVRHGTKVPPFLKDLNFRALDPLRIAAIPDAVLHVTVERQPITTEDEIDDEAPLSKKPLSEDPVITVTLPGSEYGILEVATPDYTNKPTPLSTDTAQHLSDQPDDENNNSPKDAHPPNNSSTLSSPSIQIDNIEQLIAEAGLGGASAQVRLGTIYRDGEGVSQDYVQAMEYFSMAADQGHVSAQYAIGELHFYGQGF